MDRRQERSSWKFQDYIRFVMCQITQEMCKFVEEWEPDDLTIPQGCGVESKGGGTEEEDKEREFRKSYITCVPL